MTRREWREIAAAIKGELEEWRDIELDPASHEYTRNRADAAQTAIRCVATQVALVLARYHSRFDVKAFLTECGVKQV